MLEPSKTRNAIGVAVALVALHLAPLSAFAQTPSAPVTFAVAGAVAKPASWSAKELSEHFSADIKTIDFVLKGAKHTARVLPLLAILNDSKILSNTHIKHHDLQFVIAVEGHDGYTVDFSLAEVLPDFGNRSVWVALDIDGKPLAGEEGPVELIVPDDVKPARWVHSVARIIVVDGAQAAPSPSSGASKL